MRAKDPVLAVFMWGVQHTVSIQIYARFIVLCVVGCKTELSGIARKYGFECFCA